MPIQFNASQFVEIAVIDQPIPIQHYLRQPQRLVKALVDPSRVEQLSAESFRLKMRPLNFMMLKVQPTVDMKIWAEPNGTIQVKSLSCEIRGVEYINQRFDLNLAGQLTPTLKGSTTYLVGRADLEVLVELPPPLSLMPKPLLEATGNGLLKSVLLTVKQRLLHQLLSDYRNWAVAQKEESVQERRSLLSPNTPLV